MNMSVFRLFVLAGYFSLLTIVRAESVRARLLGPEHVEIRNGTCAFSELPFFIEFTWNREQPLKLDLYVRGGAVKAGGADVVFILHDEDEREVPVTSFVSIPPMPAGSISVFRGETLRVALFAWNGFAAVKEGRRYTLSAKLSGSCRNVEIELVTDARSVEFVSTTRSAQKL